MNKKFIHKHVFQIRRRLDSSLPMHYRVEIVDKQLILSRFQATPNSAFGTRSWIRRDPFSLAFEVNNGT